MYMYVLVCNIYTYKDSPAGGGCVSPGGRVVVVVVVVVVLENDMRT